MKHHDSFLIVKTNQYFTHLNLPRNKPKMFCHSDVVFSDISQESQFPFSELQLIASIRIARLMQIHSMSLIVSWGKRDTVG